GIHAYGRCCATERATGTSIFRHWASYVTPRLRGEPAGVADASRSEPPLEEPRGEGTGGPVDGVGPARDRRPLLRLDRFRPELRRASPHRKGAGAASRS